MSGFLKIVIVEDIELFRKGLAMVINKFENVRVVAQASSAKEFLELLEIITPDIVLMDIRLPDMSGIEVTETAIKKYPDLKIIALTLFAEDEYISSMLKAGAKGFLIKNIGKEDLKKAIKDVAAGKMYYSQELMPYFYKQLNIPEKKKPKNKIKLTKRELEILKLIANGFTDSEIAEKINISHRTVNGHRNNMLLKTGAKNTVSLIIFCIKNNLLEL